MEYENEVGRGGVVEEDITAVKLDDSLKRNDERD